MNTKKIPYHFFSADIRIDGLPELYDTVLATMRLVPTATHRKGDLMYPRSKGTRLWPNDHWSMGSPLPEEVSLSEHLNWLWNQIEPHKEVFSLLITKGLLIDIFCGYRTNMDMGSFTITPDSLKVFVELGIRMEVSAVII